MWTEIHERLEASQPPFRLQSPSTSDGSAITLGRSGFVLKMLLTPRTESKSIGLYIDVAWKASAFAALQAQKDDIEFEAGGPLHWLESPDKKTGRILFEAKIDPRQPANEEHVREWFVTHTARMYDIFRNRVRNLIEPKLRTWEQPNSETYAEDTDEPSQISSIDPSATQNGE